MSEDSLPVLLNTVQTRLVQSQRQLSIVRAQVNARQREAKLDELTLEQLKGLGSGTRMYEAVGKMFMQESYEDVAASLKSKQQQALEENQMLQKKQAFLEKEASEAQTHLNDLVRSIEHANAAAQ
ncbi:hypothetical protein GLX27_000496 [Malassezia furfur]|uniref:Prefoldin subunit 1 n=1 Tax=Malassezia furfur TaxID=55194 RepID=A0ABY8EJN1_MALFU|nr:hypothetical protein CBS14141_001822 [Malassezia furfur]WFD45871.1 hypothetical protein GLX27_000496 [Malassezia furfur]